LEHHAAHADAVAGVDRAPGHRVAVHQGGVCGARQVLEQPAVALEHEPRLSRGNRAIAQAYPALARARFLTAPDLDLGHGNAEPRASVRALDHDQSEPRPVSLRIWCARAAAAAPIPPRHDESESRTRCALRSSVWSNSPSMRNLPLALVIAAV